MFGLALNLLAAGDLADLTYVGLKEKYNCVLVGTDTRDREIR